MRDNFSYRGNDGYGDEPPRKSQRLAAFISHVQFIAAVTLAAWLVDTLLRMPS